MLSLLQTASLVVSLGLAATNFYILWAKVLKGKVADDRKIKDGLRCLLRSQMVSTYYGNKEGGRIRQYEREDFDMLYASYKALGGNSFIDDIQEAVRDWEVVS